MKTTNCFVIILMLLPAWGCTIIPPKISITGEKTVIERQITGDYKELEADAWVISSVKTLSTAKNADEGIVAADEELITAIKVRRFHSDAVALYKKEGAVGENAEGFLTYRATPSYEKNKASRDILASVVRNENAARLTIFKRSLYIKNKTEPTAEEISSFGRAFAADQRANASQGDWIQNTNGNWTRK